MACSHTIPGQAGSSALTKTLLQNYSLRIKNLEDEFSMEEVPAEIRNFFVPYVRHMQAIDNIAYCLNNLFRANESILGDFKSLFHQLNGVTGTFKEDLDKLTSNLINNLVPSTSEPTFQTHSSVRSFDVSHVANIVKEQRYSNKPSKNRKMSRRKGRKSKSNRRSIAKNNSENTASKGLTLGLTLNDRKKELKWGEVICKTPLCKIRNVILGQKSKDKSYESKTEEKNLPVKSNVPERNTILSESEIFVIPKEEPTLFEEDKYNVQESITPASCKKHCISSVPGKQNSIELNPNFEPHYSSNAIREPTSIRNIASNHSENYVLADAPQTHVNYTCDRPAFSTENLLVDKGNLIVVYIVGYANPFSFRSNRPKSFTFVAGCGVWFNHNHSLNISVPMKDGAPCSYSAEIESAILAISQAKDIGVKKIKLRTSSKILYKCLTNWIGVYKRNNWLTRAKTMVKNKERLIKLDKLLSLMDVVDLEYVKERKNIAGFQGALQLAKSATLIKKEST